MVELDYAVFLDNRMDNKNIDEDCRKAKRPHLTARRRVALFISGISG